MPMLTKSLAPKCGPCATAGIQGNMGGAGARYGISMESCEKKVSFLSFNSFDCIPVLNDELLR